MTEILEDPSALQQAGRIVAERVREASNLTAEGLAELFEQAGFFAAMGFDSIENDGRLEKREDPRHTDVLVRSFTGCLLALLHLESSDTQIAENLPRFVEHTRKMAGNLSGTLALTNGSDLWLYQLDGGHPQQSHWEFKLSNLTEEQAHVLTGHLKHYQVNWRRHLRTPHL
jgi:hypothetical protein